jgi:DNA-directed RNA polymerase II subunit RPB3
MDPKITNFITDDNYLKFTLSGVNVSIANGLRRIILSEIPTIVFRTSPYEENLVDFQLNTTRMNNELIKQRLSCVPIHITDADFPHKDYVVEADLHNDTDSIIYLTTENFKIKNVQNEKYLTDGQVKKIFPPDPITNDYIELVRLRPKISDVIPGEHIKFSAQLDIGKAKEDSAFNVASTCSYGASVDPIKINEVWTNKLKELKAAGETKDSIVSIKKDWDLLDAKRITMADSYEFTIETVGPFDNYAIVNKAADIMVAKIKKFADDIESNESMIQESASTIQYCFDIKLENEDHTLGKVLEYILYTKYYLVDKSAIDKDAPNNYLTYCGFSKPHPHINESIIRIAFVSKKEKIDIVTLLVGVAESAKMIYNTIGDEFKTE